MRLGHTLAAVVTATILATATAGAADGILITQKMTSASGAVDDALRSRSTKCTCAPKAAARTAASRR